MQRQNLYKEVLFTVTHKLGGPNHVNNIGSRLMGNLLAVASGIGGGVGGGGAGGGAQQSQKELQQQHNLVKERLLEYAQEAFGVDKEEHRRIMGEAVEEKVRQAVGMSVLKSHLLSLALENTRHTSGNVSSHAPFVVPGIRK